MQTKRKYQVSELFIEISGKCNAKCPYCVKGSGVQAQGSYMSPELFDRILEHLKKHDVISSKTTIHPFNWGEPFLSPHVNSIFAIARAHQNPIFVSSNLIYLPKLTFDSLATMSAGMRISLSGFSQKSYGYIHGAQLTKVLKNFNLLHETIKSHNLGWIPYVNWHRYRFNEAEMPYARDYFRNRGIEFHPSVAHLNDMQRTLNYLSNTNITKSERSIIEKDLFADYLERCHEKSIDDFPQFDCPQWDKYLAINEKGEALLCCGWSENVPGSVLGSIFDLPLGILPEIKRSSQLCKKCLQYGSAQYGHNEDRFSLDDYLLKPQGCNGKGKKSKKKSFKKYRIQDNTPLISIGMTVFNYEKYLAKSIESLLAQDYSNIEIIISDNASTDSSGKICREYAKMDNRVVYHRNSIDVGPFRNGSKVLDASSGTYFMWASDHDLYHPQYISRLKVELDKEESVVLSYPMAKYIDADDRVIQSTSDRVDTRGLAASERFIRTMTGLSESIPMYGLFRASTLKRVFKIREVSGPDRAFLAAMSLEGAFVEVGEVLFFWRWQRPNETMESMLQRQVKWFVRNNYETIIPGILQAFEHIKVIRDSDLTPEEKESLYPRVRQAARIRWNNFFETEPRRLIETGTALLKDPNTGSETRLIAAREIASLVTVCLFFCPEHRQIFEQLLYQCLAVYQEPLSRPANSMGNTQANQAAQAAKRESVEVLLNIARRHLNENRSEEALRYIVKAKSLKQTVESMDYMRALCFAKMDRLQDAHEALREELRHFPDNQEAADLLLSIQRKTAE